MNHPILKAGPYLIVSLHPQQTDSDLLELQSQLVEQVGKLRSRGVVLDVTTLDVMDSFSTRTLRNMAEAVELRGAAAVIVGIRPEVAFAMVQLGLDRRLARIHTVLDLDEAMAVLARRQAKADGR